MSSLTLSDMASQQKEDPWIATIVNFLSSPSTLPQPRALRRQAAHFAIRDNLLYRRHYMPDDRECLFVVPRSLRAEVCAAYHDDPQCAHAGFLETSSKILLAWYVQLCAKICSCLY